MTARHFYQLATELRHLFFALKKKHCTHEKYLRAMRHPIQLSMVGLVLAGLTVFLGYFVERTDFHAFIAAYAVFFGVYAWTTFRLQQQISPHQTHLLVGLGIALRVVLLFSIPNLSDDYSRFLWDGHLTVAGIHPFAHPPNYFIENQWVIPGITPELFAKLNSPEYFTVYPPVCQAVFALAAWLFPSSEWGGVLVLKLFLLTCEIGTIWLLWHYKTTETAQKNGASALAYALNPLAILEVSGNCHFEGAMVFFLLAGLWAFQQGHLGKGAVLWALATAVKMLPLMFLPILWRWLGFRKGLIANTIFAFSSLLLFAPVLLLLPNILESLDLYFRQFQFNASIYYLVRAVGFAEIGWDIGEISGPILGGLTALGVLFLAFCTRPKTARPVFSRFDIESALLFALFMYLSLAATVQPWYAIVPLALCLLTDWRFPVGWSGLIALSYSHYEGGGRQENYWLIGVEYGLLWALLLWESRRIFVQNRARFST